MITYEIWIDNIYEDGWLFGSITALSILKCLLFSIFTIPFDILLFPIEILSLIICGIIKLIGKIKGERK